MCVWWCGGGCGGVWGVHGGCAYARGGIVTLRLAGYMCAHVRLCEAVPESCCVVLRCTVMYCAVL